MTGNLEIFWKLNKVLYMLCSVVSRVRKAAADVMFSLADASRACFKKHPTRNGKQSRKPETERDPKASDRLLMLLLNKAEPGADM